MASPHAAELAKAIAALVDASIAADPAPVEAALAAIEQRVVDFEPRRGVPLATAVSIFERDSWTCRYCAGKTIAPPVLRVLSLLYPERFPYHPNWKAGRVHPAYLLLSTTLDHVHPGRARRIVERPGEPRRGLLAVQQRQGRLHARGDRLGAALRGRRRERLDRPHRELSRALGGRRRARRVVPPPLAARSRTHLTPRSRLRRPPGSQASTQVSAPSRSHRDGRHARRSRDRAGAAHARAKLVQGTTVDRAFVLDRTPYREWGYTALSRHRDEARFYVTAPADPPALPGLDLRAPPSARNSTAH